MPMFALSTSFIRRFARHRGAAAVVEFALLLPVLLLIMVVLIEAGRGISQMQTVERGLRAGAMLAARSDWPLDGTAQTAVANLVKTGTTDGSGAFLVPGWADAGASLNITPTTTVIGGSTVGIIRLDAQVPYQELLPGMIGFFGLNQITLRASHEQVYIGN